MSSAQNYIRQFLSAKERFNSLATEFSVLFADLVGSTEFKRHHTEIEGLAKTTLHNAVITDCVRAIGGTVAKYLGDGVLALFGGEEGPLNAVRASLSCIVAIENANESQGWHDFTVAMNTKIGLHHGRVWEFEYPEATVPDPHGLTVDLASRLCGLADAQQIVCSEQLYSRAIASDPSLEHAAGKLTARLVKGLMHPVEMRSLVPQGREPRQILLTGHRMTLSNEIRTKINEGLRAASNSRIEDALVAFSEVLEADPGNFEANYRAAELCLKMFAPTKVQEKQNIDRALQYLSMAKQSRPEAPRVWYLASWARFKRFELLRDKNDLQLAVQFAETSLERAEDLMDIDGIVLAQTCLARKLLERSQWDEQTSATDLQRAAALCEDIRRDVEELHGNARAEYLTTHALVRLAQGDTDFEPIEEMVNEAEKLNPRNDMIVEVEARLRSLRAHHATVGSS